MKKILLTCCALVIGAIAGPVLAKDVQEYAVNKIKYKNRGAYTVEYLEIKYKLKSNLENTVTCKMTTHDLEDDDGASSTDITSGHERTFDLRKTSHFRPDYSNPDECNNTYWQSYIKRGTEVRTRVSILYGDVENCRKEDRVKFYYHPKGGTVTYVTRGTTLLNNRCRLQSNGGVLWKHVKHLR